MRRLAEDSGNNEEEERSLLNFSSRRNMMQCGNDSAPTGRASAQ